LSKLIIKFSAPSWLILNKYIETHGQQNIKIIILVSVNSNKIFTAVVGYEQKIRDEISLKIDLLMLSK